MADRRRRLGLPVDASLVLFSSRIAPEKDPDTLLDAVAMVRREGTDVRIVHLSGGYREFVERAAARHLSDAVIAHPAAPPDAMLADWYRAVDVCVQASRAEGLGFSPLEALACGVPVVAAAVGGLCDTIADPETGWTYPPGDAAALARALRAVLSDPDEGRRRALRGRALVERTYSRTVVFSRMRELVSALAAAPMPGGMTRRAAL
jgi:D-inositol-3-phosphate glycosyltransferase